MKSPLPRTIIIHIFGLLVATFLLLSFPSKGFAGVSIPFTINLSEAVNVTGTPRVAVDVSGITRYATYTAGTGTSALTFTYEAVAGDIDLDGVVISSPIDLNGGTIKDLAGNDMTSLTFSPPNTTNVRVNYPSLSMDFTASSTGRYSLNGIVYNSFTSFLSAVGGTFTRTGSTATYFDSSGTLQTAAADIPRFDYNPTTQVPRGILIERNSTNFIKNSVFSGINTATYTASQSIPSTNWSVYIPTSGVSGQSISLTPGTSIGIPYLDIRMQVTNTGGVAAYLVFSPILSDNMSVSNGTVTIASGWFGVTSYTSTGGTCSANLENRSMTSTGNYITSAALALTSVSPYQRRVTNTLTHGSTAAYASNWVYIAVPVGTTCDITMRFGAPQIEQGAVATSYIPTATNATATRNADNLTIPTTSGWNNATEGTLYVSALNGTNSTTVGIAALNNSASQSTNRITIIRTATSSIETLTSVGGVTQFQTSTASNGNNTLNNIGFAYATNNFRNSVNGVLGALDTSGSLPTIDQLLIGRWNSGSASYYDGWIQKVKYYPLRVTDTQLQLITQ